MSTRIALVCSAALLAASAGPGLLAGTNAPGANAAGAPAAPSPNRSGREKIDGIDYYELHGAGEPLLLLHGGLGSIDMLAPLLGKLAQSRRVIAVDLQGHGRTPLGARPFRLESIGNDMAELTRRLGFAKVDVIRRLRARSEGRMARRPTSLDDPRTARWAPNARHRDPSASVDGSRTPSRPEARTVRLRSGG
jgi:hypothetical protein